MPPDDLAQSDAQDRRADALDTKAGLVLGFAGLLVSLTPATAWPPLGLLARALAGVAAVLALRALAVSTPGWPAQRRGGPVDVRRHLAALDAALAATAAALRVKAWRISAALHLLTAALGTIAVASAVTVVRDWVR
ncbi:MAG TPA: hypothetical protein VF519_06780 [Mycobacteriales bacterium]|jgi:hypothetical protein